MKVVVQFLRPPISHFRGCKANSALHPTLIIFVFCLRNRHTVLRYFFQKIALVVKPAVMRRVFARNFILRHLLRNSSNMSGVCSANTPKRFQVQLERSGRPFKRTCTHSLSFFFTVTSRTWITSYPSSVRSGTACSSSINSRPNFYSKLSSILVARIFLLISQEKLINFVDGRPMDFTQGTGAEPCKTYYLPSINVPLYQLKSEYMKIPRKNVRSFVIALHVFLARLLHLL